MNRYDARRLLPLALVLAVLLAAACQPTIKAAPVPGRVAMAGDSIGLQAMYYGSAGHPAAGYDTADKIGLGWRAAHAQPRVTADVANTAASPATLVAEFGHNYRDGLTSAARNEVTALMFSPADTACVVAVLPYAPAFLPATHRQAITDYRRLVSDIAVTRPHTVTVDWAPIATAHPEYLDEDGIHLRTPLTDPAQDLQAAAVGDVNVTDPTAAAAFITMVEQGVASCD